MWVIYALLAAAGAAAVAILGKLGLKGLDSTLATTVRSIIMALFLVLVSLLFGKFRGFTWSALNSKDWLLISLAGIAGAMSWLFYFLALKQGPATAVVALDRLSLVLVAALAFLVLKEPLSARAWLGVALMVAGAIFVSWK